MSFSLRHRPGEVGVTIEADALEDVFEQAVAAVRELLGADGEGVGDRLPVLVRGSDVAQLLADFVADLLELADYEQFAAGRVERLQLDDRQVRAALSGRTGGGRDGDDLGLHAFDLRRVGGAWRADFVVTVGRRRAAPPAA